VWKYEKRLAIALPLFVVINIYVVFSWWCWWYGGSFGMRSLIESYALLAFPMAAFWTEMQKRMVPHCIALVFGLFFIMLNQFQTRQYREGMLHWDSISGEFYKRSFFRAGWVPEGEKMLDPPDYEAAMEGRDE
ncbi:MAG: hypothetical protein M3Q97_02860, partial [Bacteroidota bacterium]|nr:hypothetical protein [Bacteroidota bacterium]